MKNFLSLMLLSGSLISGSVNAADKAEFVSKEIVDKTIAENAELFKNWDDIDLEKIAQIRAKCDAIESKNPKLSAYKSSNSFNQLKDYVLKAEKYIEKLEKVLPIEELEKVHPKLKKLKNEIQKKIKQRKITPLWAHILGFRIQAAISKPTKEELDFVEHVSSSGAELIAKLKHQDAWKSYEKCMAFSVDFKPVLNYYKENIATNDIDVKIRRHALAQLEKVLPLSFTFPLYNKSKLAMPKLLWAYLNDVYPISISSKGGKAHGINFSPLVFTIHDETHSYIGNEHRHALNGAYSQDIARQIKQGDKKLLSQPIIQEFAVDRFNLLAVTFKEIFNAFVGKLHKDRDIDSFKKIVTGWFWIIHEQRNHFSYKMYQTEKLADILKLYAGGRIQSAESSQVSKGLSDTYQSKKEVLKAEKGTLVGKMQEGLSWEGPEDLFVTLPDTGDSFLTDQEIKNIAFEFLNPKYQTENSEMRLSDVNLKEDADFEVIRGKRFIDVKMYGENGAVYFFAAPTLFHKWNNIEDSLHTLKYAGIELEKPVLEGDVRQKRETVLKTLENVQTELQNVQQYFLDEALKIIETTKNAEHRSLKEWYADQYQTLKNNYEDKLTELFKDKIKKQ